MRQSWGNRIYTHGRSKQWQRTDNGQGWIHSTLWKSRVYKKGRIYCSLFLTFLMLIFNLLLYILKFVKQTAPYSYSIWKKRDMGHGKIPFPQKFMINFNLQENLSFKTPVLGKLLNFQISFTQTKILHIWILFFINTLTL